MPSLRQICDSDLPPGLISPIYLVWNPMVFVHLINLIKIFGLFKNRKQTTTTSWTYILQGSGLGANCTKKKMERLVNWDIHCDAINIYIFKGRERALSQTPHSNRPSAFPRVPRECLWHHNTGFFGASSPPLWALILQKPLDCKPHTCCIATTRSWTVPVSKNICENLLCSNACNFSFPLFDYWSHLNSIFIQDYFFNILLVWFKKKRCSNLSTSPYIVLLWLFKQKWRKEKTAAIDNCETVIFYKIEDIQVLSFSCFILNLKSQMLPLYCVQTSCVIKRLCFRS